MKLTDYWHFAASASCFLPACKSRRGWAWAQDTSQRVSFETQASSELQQPPGQQVDRDFMTLVTLVTSWPASLSATKQLSPEHTNLPVSPRKFNLCVQWSSVDFSWCQITSTCLWLTLYSWWSLGQQPDDPMSSVQPRPRHISPQNSDRNAASIATM